ncbi:DUF4832 domain-containing protein [Sphingobacterium yanglingense]|uniref:Uncharacterized protein DUF4874 n=1 Tax=Sphingobacterium yanglingense TaxID=1437280 RepID=A0A4R6WG38_9SPHI|nr:DUF4832 domain-containing protein [Sphingobacterium yanglingense]TDQ76346.1 uncharacterized protein DUF4874 [Sphingobacterium yanglingense]
MKIKIIIGCLLGCFLIVFLLTYSCQTKDLDLVKIEKINIAYIESNEDFANPERGFYRYSETSSSNYTVLTPDELTGYRSPQSISGANYQVLSTLVFRYYVLDDVINTAISTAFLTNMRSDFEAARKAGVKLIPRFVYTTTANPGNCPEGFICPPYGDAPKAIVLQHINQLKPILHDNADVIACVQLGFIGVWGEQYYSDFFGDASQNADQGKLLDQNWNDRIEIIKALLQAVPHDRMVQLRYPQLKQRYIYGVDAPVTAAALSESNAFNETDIARLGFHNDCFMANVNDLGTYEDYGNSSTDRSSTASVQNILKKYAEGDGKFVVVGGETCMDGYNPDNNCEPAGRIQAEFAAKHYSFINAHYNNDVNNDWQEGGCMDNIKRNLGYRFVLQNATLPDNTVLGTAMNITLNVKNVGYASPYNKRPLKLILRNIQTGAIESLVMSTDVRKWYSGEVKVEESILIPKNLSKGDYEMLLHLPDAYASISSRPEYAIRFANTDMWEANTGYNKLNHIVKVN